MKIEHILLDMDGVLVDFSGAACALHGKPGTEILSWDMWNYLGLETEDDFWGKIDAVGVDFWTGLNKYPWFDQLFALLSGYPWTIATTPSKDPTSAYGKRVWLGQQFGRDFTNYMLGKQKHLLAKPGVLLIDDSDKNIRLFREAGGKAILFPQPWNHNRSLTGDRIEYVRSQLNIYRSTDT